MNHDQSDVSPADSYFDVADYDLNPQTWNLGSLQTMATQRRLPRPRALAWAVLLCALPEPGEQMLLSLQTHRNTYHELKKQLSQDPRAFVDDDPLSQNDESAWKQHFCDNELKRVIRQDVVRTHPDEEFFREPQVQDAMVWVLFAWARAHPAVSYRQGMHEVLAPLLLQLDADAAAAPPSLCDTLKEYFQEEYREHDSFMLFTAVMRGLVRFYATDAVPHGAGQLPAARAAHQPTEVVRYLTSIRDELLTPLDEELATHLTDCNVSLELFGIRWLRLLFGREFPRGAVPALWGFLFAEGPALPRLHHVVVALLICMRDELLHRSPDAVLARLMSPAQAHAPRVTRLALHLAHPLVYPAPVPAPAPAPAPAGDDGDSYTCPARADSDAASDSSSGLAEGGDVGAALAALAALRRALPPAAAALRAALRRELPAPSQTVRREMDTILRLAALVQCRSHELVDVETALEAAEGAPPAQPRPRRQLVPVSLIAGRRPQQPPRPKPEVPLTVFREAECARAADLPRADPARLRTQ